MSKALADMTDEQFERWLKRQGITGIGAFNISQSRKAQIAAREKEFPTMSSQDFRDNAEEALYRASQKYEASLVNGTAKDVEYARYAQVVMLEAMSIVHKLSIYK